MVQNVYNIRSEFKIFVMNYVISWNLFLDLYFKLEFSKKLLEIYTVRGYADL
jgi:hypothetical protein